MLAKAELLFNKQISRSPIMHSDHEFFEDLESNNERTASIPLSLSMLGNILTIPNEARISFPVNYFCLYHQLNLTNMMYLLLYLVDLMLKVCKCFL